MAADAERSEAQPLADLRIALAGRLASLSHAAAADLIVRHGGRSVTTVTQATNLLVIGRHRSPLRRNGRLSRQLSRVEALRRRGIDVEVIAEEEFLHRLGLFSAEQTLGLHPLSTLSQTIGIDSRTIAAWLRGGLIAPAEIRAGVPLFDYAGIAAARSVADLLAAGIRPRTITRSLIRLRESLQQETATATIIARLSLAAGYLALPTDDGRWIEPHGQLLFDYAAPETTASLPLRPPDEQLYERAVAAERCGELAAAAELYHRLLERGPDADVCLNLGNVLYALDRPDAAAERFRQAVELDTSLAEAWNNLGNCLGDAGDVKGAVQAFRRAVAVEPDFALAWENLGSLLDDAGERDGAAYAYRQALAIEPENAAAHRALAAVLDDAGQRLQARPHWQAYLQREPAGEWAAYAHSRLSDGQRA